MTPPFGAFWDRTIRFCRRMVIALPCLLAAWTVACNDTELLDRRGLIIDGDSLVVAIPAEFRVDKPDTVMVLSFGNDCVSFARTEVTVVGLDATVEPFDFDRALSAFDESAPLSDLNVCNDIGRQVVHVAELTFDRSGEATIWFIGLDRWIDSAGWRDSIVFVPRQVPVR